MYARLARFEGSDPAALEKELDDMREQIKRGMTDEAMQEMNEQMGGGLDSAQMDAMRKIRRTLVLADVEKGSSAMVIFCDTEDEIRAIDALFDQMSPPTDGGGKRQSVDLYEVAIDEEMA